MGTYDEELKAFLQWWEREGSRPIPNNEALAWQHSAPLRAFDAWRASAKRHAVNSGPLTIPETAIQSPSGVVHGGPLGIFSHA